MKKRKNIVICLSVLSILLCSCNNASKSEIETEKPSVETQVNNVPCELTINNIHFTKSINNAASFVEVSDSGKVVFKSEGNTDYFSDPNGTLQTTAPILLSSIDNTKPFTFTAKVTPKFNADDTYNAGVLYVYANDSLFQKLCFEQDERGNHRIVTVRTVGTSDDNNHTQIDLPYVYMKISSDTQTIASYYSLDNETWWLVRLYKNNYPDKLWVGISNQCPKGKGSVSIFEEFKLEQNNVSNFRLGF